MLQFHSFIDGQVRPEDSHLSHADVSSFPAQKQRSNSVKLQSPLEQPFPKAWKNHWLFLRVSTPIYPSSHDSCIQCGRHLYRPDDIGRKRPVRSRSVR